MMNFNKDTTVVLKVFTGFREEDIDNHVVTAEQALKFLQTNELDYTDLELHPSNDVVIRRRHNIIEFLTHMCGEEDQYVYQTLRQSDMTEGRGRMVNDLCFSTYELAAEYIDSKPGVMGRKGKWSTDRYGDWKIEKFKVYTSIESEEDRARRKALAKLTDEERKLLGL